MRWRERDYSRVGEEGEGDVMRGEGRLRERDKFSHNILILLGRLLGFLIFVFVFPSIKELTLYLSPHMEE